MAGLRGGLPLLDRRSRIHGTVGIFLQKGPVALAGQQDHPIHQNRRTNGSISRVKNQPVPFHWREINGQKKVCQGDSASKPSKTLPHMLPRDKNGLRYKQ